MTFENRLQPRTQTAPEVEPARDEKQTRAEVSCGTVNTGGRPVTFSHYFFIQSA